MTADKPAGAVRMLPIGAQLEAVKELDSLVLGRGGAILGRRSIFWWHRKRTGLRLEVRWLR